MTCLNCFFAFAFTFSSDLEMQSQLQINQSRIDDITLKEDVPEASRMPFGADFGVR